MIDLADVPEPEFTVLYWRDIYDGNRLKVSPEFAKTEFGQQLIFWHDAIVDAWHG